MTETAATKLTSEQKMVLDYIAAQQRVTVSGLIRQALFDAYGLDSTIATAEAASFFSKARATVKHNGHGRTAGNPSEAA